MAATVIKKQLGQSRPSNTTAVSLYSPDAYKEVQLLSLYVANVSGASAKFRVFHDEDGTTYDQTTALFYDIAVQADTTIEIAFDEVYMRNSSGNLAVRTDTGDAFNFTLYGRIEDVSDFERTRTKTVAKPTASAATRGVT